MKPNSTELDKEIAAKVYVDPIRHEWRTIGDIGAYDECVVCGYTCGEGKGEELGCVPPFSLYIECAWSLVDKLESLTCDFSLEKAGTLWTASITSHSGSGDTPMEAICRLALATVSR
jgi:hypothetical protein